MKIENSIFLLLDMQERLVPAMYEKEKLEKSTEILLKGINELSIPVIYTEQYPKGLGNTIDSLKKELKDAKYFSKVEFSAFDTIKEEILKLKANSRDCVIVSGAETHICVYQTIRALIENGFKVYVPFETVGSRSRCNIENGLSLIRELGANVTNVETILFDLIKTSKHESFKAISTLIK